MYGREKDRGVNGNILDMRIFNNVLLIFVKLSRIKVSMENIRKLFWLNGYKWFF